MARTRSTVLVLVVASLALILWDLRASDTAARSVALQVVTPLQRTAASLFAPLGSWARDVEGFTDPVVRAQAAAPIDPVVPDRFTAEKCLDAMLEANRDYLPRFYR